MTIHPDLIRDTKLSMSGETNKQQQQQQQKQNKTKKPFIIWCKDLMPLFHERLTLASQVNICCKDFFCETLLYPFIFKNTNLYHV